MELKSTGKCRIKWCENKGYEDFSGYCPGCEKLVYDCWEVNQFNEEE